MKKEIGYLKIAFSLLLLVQTLSSVAQTADFRGKWCADKSKTAADDFTKGLLTIEQKTATWNIFPNQLFLDFRNRMRDDTLLLIYKSCDCSKVYKESTIRFPKSGSIVAKCYITPYGQLGVIYVNTRFVKSVRDYAQMSNSEKAALFPDYFYRIK